MKIFRNMMQKDEITTLGNELEVCVHDYFIE